MANPKHVEIVKQGRDAIAEWRGDNPDGRLDLSGADLEGADLSRANLDEANLIGADLSAANLTCSRLNGTDLIGADLSGANLVAADLYKVDLEKAKFEKAISFATVWADVDLSTSVGLETIQHRGPSTLSFDTMSRSKGRIPEAFLRGCGLTPWQAKLAGLFNPELSPSDIANLLSTDLFMSRTEEMEYPGVFISYSHADSTFVDKLHGRLYGQGLSVWPVRQLLANKKYVGVMQIGSFAKGKYFRIGQDGTIQPASDVPVRPANCRRDEPVRAILDAHPALIEQHVFDVVQDKIKRRAAADGRQRPTTYILAGILRCHHCGTRMTGQRSGGSTQNKLTYYACRGWYTGGCKGHRIRQSAIEPFVMDYVLNELFGDAAIEDVKETIRALGADRNTAKSEAEQLERKIADIDIRQTRGRKNLLLVEGDDAAAVRDMLKDLQQRRDSLVRQLEIVTGSQADPKDVERRAIDYINQIRERCLSGRPMEMRQVLKELFDNITLEFEGPNRKRRVRRGVIALKKNDRSVAAHFSSRTASPREPAGCRRSCVRTRCRQKERGVVQTKDLADARQDRFPDPRHRLRHSRSASDSA